MAAGRVPRHAVDRASTTSLFAVRNRPFSLDHLQLRRALFLLAHLHLFTSSTDTPRARAAAAGLLSRGGAGHGGRQRARPPTSGWLRKGGRCPPQTAATTVTGGGYAATEAAAAAATAAAAVAAAQPAPAGRAADCHDQLAGWRAVETRRGFPPGALLSKWDSDIMDKYTRMYSCSKRTSPILHTII